MAKPTPWGSSRLFTLFNGSRVFAVKIRCPSRAFLTESRLLWMSSRGVRRMSLIECPNLFSAVRTSLLYYYPCSRFICWSRSSPQIRLFSSVCRLGFAVTLVFDFEYYTPFYIGVQTTRLPMSGTIPAHSYRERVPPPAGLHTHGQLNQCHEACKETFFVCNRLFAGQGHVTKSDHVNHNYRW